MEDFSTLKLIVFGHLAYEFVILVYAALLKVVSVARLYVVVIFCIVQFVRASSQCLRGIVVEVLYSLLYKGIQQQCVFARIRFCIVAKD